MKRRFEHDVKVNGGGGGKMGFVMSKGNRIRVIRVQRESADLLETNQSVRLPRPVSVKHTQAAVLAFAERRPIRVLAVDKNKTDVFDRGLFTIVFLSRNYMTLSRANTTQPATSSSSFPSSSSPSPSPLPLPSPSSSPSPSFENVMTKKKIVSTTVHAPHRPFARMMPRAIPTCFKGITFRSRLEARFASLMTALRVNYVYEPVRCNLDGGKTYTIDFFLPDQQLYVELKPKRPHIEEEQKCEQMSSRGFRVTLLYGSAVGQPPFRSEFFKGKSHRDYAHHDALRGITWIGGKKLAGEAVFVRGRHPTFRTPLDVVDPDAVHLNHVESSTDTRWSHPSILAAFRSVLVTPPS